jgi:hypothetical protein
MPTDVSAFAWHLPLESASPGGGQKTLREASQRPGSCFCDEGSDRTESKLICCEKSKFEFTQEKIEEILVGCPKR